MPRSIVLAPLAFAALALSARPAPAQPGSGARYGARDARKCHVAAPRTAPSSAQVAQAFVCRDEEVNGNGVLFLDDSVRVQVGRPRPYNHGTDGYQDIDVRRPIYPIRGSFVRYQCTRRDWVLTGQDPNRNCDAYPESDAEGICYATTFGDLWCAMSSTRRDEVRRNVAPPRG